MPRRLLLCAGLAAAGAAVAQEHHHHGAGPAAEAASPQAAEPGSRQGRREWTRAPLLAPAGPGGERGAVPLRPIGIEATDLQVFAADGPPDRRKIPVPVEAGIARIAPVTPRIGNYHWVMARSEKDGEVRVASTVVYFSNPGGAPTAMLALPKNELEIVPAPLPREHGVYRESEKWNFLVRFDGAPLADQPVTMETEFGSRSTLVSDKQGRVVVLFPRDFKAGERTAPRAGGHAMGPRPAGFVLTAERDDGGRHYLTAFNYGYTRDADRGKSLAWGAAFGLLGMVAATPLLRRRHAGKQEGADA